MYYFGIVLRVQSVPEKRDLATQRVGLLVPSLHVPRWVADLIQRLLESRLLEVALVVAEPRARPRPARGPARALYELLDRLLLAREEDGLERDVLRGERLARLVVLDAELAGRANLDVLFVTESGAAAEAIPTRCGIWGWRADPAGSALAVSLVRVDGKRAEILAEAYLARSPISQYRNHAHAAWKAGDLLLRRLTEVPGARLDPMRDAASATASDPFRPSPLAVTRELVRRQIRWRLYRSEWFVAYRLSGGPFVLLAPPYGQFFADPFPIERDGRRFLFFEHYLPHLRRAVISYVEIRRDGSASLPRIALALDRHLSYPFVFVLGGDVYMLPSTRTGIELYRAEAFPQGWTFERALMRDVEANDATLLLYEGRIWLFANIVRPRAEPNEELHLFWADSLDGEWTPHPANPVLSDVRSARPAGRIFEHDGAFLRPAQDCSALYGQAVVLNRIEALTGEAYREVAVGRIEPEWLPGNVGTHTYNVEGDLEVIDGYQLRPRRPFPRPRRRIVRVRPSGELVRPLPRPGRRLRPSDRK